MRDLISDVIIIVPSAMFLWYCYTKTNDV